MARKRPTILLVEDEYLIAMAMEIALIDHGYDVLGPFGRVAEAERALAEGGDIAAALLDYNLNGKTSAAIAAALQERGTPTFFLTGLHDHAILADFPDARILRKPVQTKELVSHLQKALGHECDGL